MTRDRTADPVSGDHILRRERGQGNTNFPCSADNKWDWPPCSNYSYDNINSINALATSNNLLNV